MNYKELPDLLTTQEVADILRVDNLTIRRYIKAGRMEAYKLPNGVFRIPKESVKYLFKGQNED